MNRGLIAVLAVFFLGGPALLAGATWSYLDEHSGPKAKAHVLRCKESGSGKGSVLFCTGTWTRDGHTVTGFVHNARKGDVGKDVDVRLHGGHASRPQLWVSVALAIFGLVTLGMGIFLIGAFRRARGRASGETAGTIP